MSGSGMMQSKKIFDFNGKIDENDENNNPDLELQRKI